MDTMVMPVFAVIIFGLLGIFVAMAATVFWIWMLVECIRFEQGDTRLLWALIILFAHGLGALLYFLIRRRERRAEVGR